MDKGENPKAKMEQLEEKKRRLIDRIREVGAKMRSRREEIVRLVPSLRGKAWLRGDKTRSEIDSIEFEISTSAYTLAQEKAMIKKLKKVQDDMDQALKLDGMRDKVDAARKEMDGLAKERDDIDAQLKTVRAELEAAYAEILTHNSEEFKKMREKREHRRHEMEMSHRTKVREGRRKEENNELAPYMKQHDDFVSLEEIAEIKRKPAKEEENAAQ